MTSIGKSTLTDRDNLKRAVYVFNQLFCSDSYLIGHGCCPFEKRCDYVYSVIIHYKNKVRNV